MELVSYMAHEEFSDHPDCTCPVIASFIRSWNDGMNDSDRNRILKPILPKIIGTASTDEIQQRRAWMATDFMCRQLLPAFLRLAKLNEDAVAIQNLPPFASPESLKGAKSFFNAARVHAAAAGDAAWDAAGAAAMDAARAAAEKVLRPTVEHIQAEALKMIERMIAA
jgi:hypothetical protein